MGEPANDEKRCRAKGAGSPAAKPPRRRCSKPARGATEAPLPPSDVAGPTVSSVDVFDLDDALGWCGGRHELFQEMVEYCFTATKPLLTQIRAALGRGDMQEAARAAHKLKGTLSYLGTSVVLEAVERVQRMRPCKRRPLNTAAIDRLERQIELLLDALRPHRRRASK